MNIRIPQPFKEIVMVSAMLIAYAAIGGIWAFALLLAVELLFGPLEQDGIVFQLTIIIGIMVYILFAPRIARN
jgi:hypothetical protein